MTLTNKTRLGKRILEMWELGKYQQITTSKKHDKIGHEKFKDLEEKYNKLKDDELKNMIFSQVSFCQNKNNNWAYPCPLPFLLCPNIFS